MLRVFRPSFEVVKEGIRDMAELIKFKALLSTAVKAGGMTI